MPTADTEYYIRAGVLQLHRRRGRLRAVKEIVRILAQHLDTRIDVPGPGDIASFEAFYGRSFISQDDADFFTVIDALKVNSRRDHRGQSAGKKPALLLTESDLSYTVYIVGVKGEERT